MPDIDQLYDILLPIIEDDDVVLSMGAGTIGKAIRSAHRAFEQGGGHA